MAKSDRARASGLEQHEVEALKLQIGGFTHHMNNVLTRLLLLNGVIDRGGLAAEDQETLDTVENVLEVGVDVVRAMSGLSSFGGRVPVNLRYLANGLQKQGELLLGKAVTVSVRFPEEPVVGETSDLARLHSGCLGLVRRLSAALETDESLVVRVDRSEADRVSLWLRVPRAWTSPEAGLSEEEEAALRTDLDAAACGFFRAEVDGAPTYELRLPALGAGANPSP